jgi:hypothetical protein
VPTLVENLTAARDNLAAVIALQTAAWVASGCPPTFSIDGESYDWNNWLAGKTAAIENLTTQIQSVGGPFLIRSRVRA